MKKMNKKQILFINGWVSKSNYINYMDYLEKLEYNPFKIKEKSWRHTFTLDLWNDYEVINPIMPNKGFADYNEWKIMFEKTFQYLRNDVILLGHSLGATFLIKYLNKNNFPKKIKKIFLIAWAFEDDDLEVLWNFNFDKKLKNLKKHENKLVFFQSKDDEVVLYSDLEKFRKIFLTSKYHIFENRWHFIWKEFRELLSEIKKI